MTTPAGRLVAGWKQEEYLAFSARMAAHAAKWVTGWRMAGAALPKGQSVEDLVCEALEDVMTGRRTWDPARHVFEALVKLVIVSKVRNLMKSPERRANVPLVDPDVGARGPAVAEEDLLSEEAAQDELLEYAEAQRAAARRLQALREAIIASVRKAEDCDAIELILMAMEDGATKPADIEAATGIARERIYKLLERVRAIAATIPDDPGDSDISERT